MGAGPSLRLPLLQDSGLGGGEPPEKERRRLKESFENYRRWARMDAGRGGGRAGSAPRTPGTPAPSAPRQEARAPEDAARLETGRGGLGEHDGQRQHRHRGLLATRPACRRTPRRPRARSGPPAAPARAPPPSAVSFSARPFPRQHTHYLYVTRTPGSVRNAALKINDRRVRRLCWRAHRPPPGGSRARPARRGGSGQALPPLPASKMAVARPQLRRPKPGRGGRSRREGCCERRWAACRRWWVVRGLGVPV